MGLSFLAPVMLAGLLAAAVPVVIHLIHRRQARILPIATLRFLRQIPARTIRKRQLEEYILLAARMLLLALLALGAARPVLTDATAGGGATAAVVVLDDSYSMQYRVSGITRFTEAKEAAGRVVRTLAKGDRAALITASRSSGATLATDLDGLVRKIGAALPAERTRDLRAAMEKAFRLLEEAPEPNRELTLITDLQLRATAPLLTKLKVRTEDRPIRITIIDVGVGDAANAGITGVGTGAGVAIAGESIRVSATIRNSSSAPLTTRAYLVIGGERVAEERVSIAPNETAIVAFSTTAGLPGATGGEVVIDGDALMRDDVRHFVRPVIGRIPVLLVDGDPSPIRYQDEAFFLQAALAPEDLGAENIRSPVNLTVVTPEEFSAQDLAPYRVLILANPPPFMSREITSIRAFVRRGGGLLLFGGNRVDTAAMNRDFGADRERGILPALISPPAQLESDPEAVIPLEDADHRHPLFADLPEKALRDLTKIHVRRALGADPLSAGGIVVASLAGGAPLIVTRDAGRGRVMLVTTSADADWGNFPLRPLFLPLMHRAIRILSGRGAEARSFLVGDSASIPPPAVDQPPPEITDPAGEIRRLAIEPGPDGFLAFGPLAATGLYRVRGSGIGEDYWFPVNVDPTEGDLTRISPKRLIERFGSERTRLISDTGTLTEVLTRSREGRPIWGFVLAAALLLLLFEGFFANRIARARAARDATTEDVP